MVKLISGMTFIDGEIFFRISIGEWAVLGKIFQYSMRSPNTDKCQLNSAKLLLLMLYLRKYKVDSVQEISG